MDIRFFDCNKYNKDDFIKLRISKEEKDIIKKYCKEKNIKVSEYIYALICKDMEKNKNI